MRRVITRVCLLSCRVTNATEGVLATGLEQAIYIPVDAVEGKFEKLQIIGGNYAGVSADPKPSFKSLKLIQSFGKGNISTPRRKGAK